MSIILKLMGRPLGYRALQSRLAGIWHPIGTMHLIDIGYGYFIMRFDVIKDYHHAPHGWSMVCGRSILTCAGLGGGFSPTYCQNHKNGCLDLSRTTSYRILPSRISQTRGIKTGQTPKS